MADIVQYADGSLALRNEVEGTDLGRWGGPKTPSQTNPRYGGSKTVKIPLTANDAAAGIFTWSNNEPVAVIVTKVLIDVTTGSSAACSISVGQAATPVLSSNLPDTLLVATLGTFDNITDKGTNGKSRQRVAPGQVVTGSKASGASAGLVGNLYLDYVLV
jgi:hypothetical protein